MKRKGSSTLKRFDQFQRAGALRVPRDLAPFQRGGPDAEGEWFLNNFYQVQMTVTPDGGNLLSIKPKDGSARHDWREFQWIKNELCGEEREAVEIYPAESRLVDTSNQFWLFVLPPGFRLRFGWTVRAVSEVVLWSTSTQRPFPEEKRPADLMTVEQAREGIKTYLAAGEGDKGGEEPAGGGGE